MLKLEDSWIWQDGQEQGLEQGETRATLRSIHKYWNLRFCAMPKDLAGQLASVPTSADLERIQDVLFQAPDKAAALAALGVRSRPRGRRLSNGKHA